MTIQKALIELVQVDLVKGRNEMENFEMEKGKMEIRVRVTINEWGGTTSSYICHFANVEEMVQFEEETGYECELLNYVYSNEF